MGEEHQEERRVELHHLSVIIGSLQGSVDGLKEAQVKSSTEVREDIRLLHAKLDAMYQHGCARSGQHDETERQCRENDKNVRELQNWKAGREAETKAIASIAGEDSGGKAGGKWAAIISAIGGVITYWLSTKGSGQ